MKEKLYNVIFLGSTHNDVNHLSKLTEGLMDRFNLSISSANKMMSWAPITVKKGLTFEQAADYRVVLESLGAQVKLEPMDGASGDKPVFRHTLRTRASKRNPFLLITVMTIIIAIVLILLGVNIITMYRDSGKRSETEASLREWRKRAQSKFFFCHCGELKEHSVSGLSSFRFINGHQELREFH